VLISSFSSNRKTLLKVKGPFDVFGEFLMPQGSQAQRRAHAHIDTQVYKVGFYAEDEIGHRSKSGFARSEMP